MKIVRNLQTVLLQMSKRLPKLDPLSRQHLILSKDGSLGLMKTIKPFERPR